MVDILLSEALEIYEIENRGTPAGKDIRDVSYWLIKAHYEQYGLESTKSYIRKELWEDVIKRI